MAQDNGQFIFTQSDGSIASYGFADQQVTPVGSLNDPTGIGQHYYYNNNWWCLSTDAGKFNNGVLFTLDLDGSNYKKLYDFEYTFHGQFFHDNKIWGITRGYKPNDGDYGDGTLAYYDLINQEYQIVHHFEEQNGANPTSLILINDKIWGATSNGFGLEDEDSDGVIFNYDIAEKQYNVIYRLADDLLGGSSPSMLVYNGSKIFGVYNSGNFSALFSCELDGSEMQHQWLFNGNVISGRPNSLINEDGDIFGVTNDAWFEYVASARTPFLTGSNYFKDQGAGSPLSIMKLDGKYYGVTDDEGDHDLGTIYSLSGGQVTTLHSFAGEGNGAEPRQPFVIHDDQFFGFTSWGYNESAIMYQLDPSDNSFSKLHTFDDKNGGGWRNLLHTDDRYFITGYKGGAYGNGTVLSIEPETYEKTKILDFEINGSDLLYHNNMLYGVSAISGSSIYGYIFRIDTEGNNFEVLFDFEYSDGRRPRGKLSFIDGRLWGLNDYVFSLKDDGTDFQIEHDFSDSDDEPEYGLIAYDQKVWGISKDQNTYNQGGLYSIDLVSGEFKEHVSFSGYNYVKALPYLYSGSLYMTEYGENSQYGWANLITKFDLNTHEHSVLYSFESTAHHNTTGIVAFRGRLWGTTRVYPRNEGVLYSMDMAGSDYQVHHTFTDDAQTGGKFFPIVVGNDFEEVAIEIMNLTGIQYGDESFELMATSNSDATISFTSSDENIIGIKGKTATIKNSGECTITASQNSNDSYFSGNSQQKVSVAKAPLTITAEDISIPTTTTIPELVMVYNGFVNGDSKEDIVPPSISTDGVAGTAGEYDIALTGGSADNYTFTLVGGKLVIEEQETEIEESVLSLGSQAYGVKLYPNPATHSFSIENIPNFKSIAIYDSSGQLIKQSHQSTVQISTFETGLYHVMVVAGQNRYHYRLLKN